MRGLVVILRLGACAALLALAGCSTSRLAVGAMVPVLDNARDVALASDDVETFRDAAAANLFLLEGLIATDPRRVELRVDAAMLGFAYAYAFVEDDNPAYASRLYDRGFRHALAALRRRNGRVGRAWDAPVGTFEASLRRLRRRDVPAAVWAAVNRGQFIALHLDSTAVLRDIPRVTALLERAAELDGDYFDGVVWAMIGALHAFRPPMMGGSPEKSAEAFERAFAVSGGRFLLARVLHARYYLYRVQDADAFEHELREVVATPDRPGDPYRLLNRIARMKARQLMGDIDELF